MPNKTVPARREPSAEKIDYLDRAKLWDRVQALEEVVEALDGADSAIQRRLADLEGWVADLEGWRTEMADAEPTPTPHGAADMCGFSGDLGHDWILGIEDRGVAGVAELIARIELTLGDVAGEDEEVPVWDLPDLCARHNWKDPASVERVVSFIIGAMRSRRGHLPL